MTQPLQAAVSAAQTPTQAGFSSCNAPYIQHVSEFLLSLNGYEANGDLTYSLDCPDLWAAAYLANNMSAEDYSLDDLIAMYKADPLHDHPLSLAADATCLRRAQLITYITSMKRDDDFKLTGRESTLLSELKLFFPSLHERAQVLLNAPTTASEDEIVSGDYTVNNTERAWIGEYFLECTVLSPSDITKMSPLASMLGSPALFTMRLYILCERLRRLYHHSL